MMFTMPVCGHGFSFCSIKLMRLSSVGGRQAWRVRPRPRVLRVDVFLPLPSPVLRTRHAVVAARCACPRRVARVVAPAPSCAVRMR
jgi:hypothetical protein